MIPAKTVRQAVGKYLAARSRGMSERDAVAAVTEPLIREVARLRRDPAAAERQRITDTMAGALGFLYEADARQLAGDTARAFELFRRVKTPTYRALERRALVTGDIWPMRQLTPAGQLAHEIGRR